MSDSLKKIVIISILVLITIPFILLADIFPFMRFGMFAEPVKAKIQMEVFEVTYLNLSHHEAVLDPKTIGIEPHFFLSLARNYYYRNESEKFLDYVDQIANKKDIMEWRLKKIIPPYENTRGDTVIISKRNL